MELYPAIDLLEGQVVRLIKGDFAQKTVYSSDPAAFAKQWEDEGTNWIHVVDLDGAKTGVQKNWESLVKIRETVRCRIQFGGGLRSLETISRVLDQGIDRVIVGTKAMDRKFLDAAVQKFGEKLAIGLDAKNGIVQTQGWLDSGNPTLESALNLLNEYPISTVIYTDIQKDGMLAGPNFEGLENVLKLANANVILSGGVSTLNDIRACLSLTYSNFDGAIMGKALYEKKFQLNQAVALVRETQL